MYTTEPMERAPLPAKRRGYNAIFEDGPIGASVHPVRWILAVAVAIPLFLLLWFFMARLAGSSASACDATRSIRLTLIFELVGVVLLAMIGVVYERRTEERDRNLYPPPGKLIDIGGYRFHLHCSGQGPTVVLEYGQQGSYVDWHRVQPMVAEFARVCIYDRGGYGWSDRSPRARVPRAMADELHTLLHTAGETVPYILVGHSFGGLNSLMFAHSFPQEVAGVVLVDASVPEMMSAMRRRDSLTLRMMQMAIPFGLPRWRGWCGGNAPAEIRGMKQAITCRSALYEAYYREWSSFPESAAEIRAITSIGPIPLIVIARDPTLAGNSAREMEWNRLQRERTKISSSSEFEVASGSGHDIPMDRPDVIAEAVKLLVHRQ